MAKLSTYDTANLALNDKIPFTSDPSGTPVTKNAVASQALVNINNGAGFNSVSPMSGTPPTYVVTLADWGKTIVTNESVTNYVTAPSGMPDNFWFRVLQLGTGNTVVQGNGTSGVTGVSSSGDILRVTGSPKALMDVVQYATDSFVCAGSNLTIPPFANSYSITSSSSATTTYFAAGNLNSVLNSASEFSYSFWYKGANSTSLWFFTTAEYLILESDGQLTLSFNGVALSNQDIGSVLGNGSWNFFTITFSSGTFTVHINGVQRWTNATYPSTARNTFGNSFRIGGTPDGYGYFSSGSFRDNVAFWSNALSLNEHIALYNSGAPISYGINSGNYVSAANLLHWWKMGDDDAGSGTTVSDAIGTSHGTLNGNLAFSTDIA